MICSNADDLDHILLPGMRCTFPSVALGPWVGEYLPKKQAEAGEGICSPCQSGCCRSKGVSLLQLQQDRAQGDDGPMAIDDGNLTLAFFLGNSRPSLPIWGYPFGWNKTPAIWWRSSSRWMRCTSWWQTTCPWPWWCLADITILAHYDTMVNLGLEDLGHGVISRTPQLPRKELQGRLFQGQLARNVSPSCSWVLMGGWE